MDKAIEQVLKTWYEPDHPLHLDPLHPAIGLAGEAGELLDLYKKEQFKDRVSWWDCVHCSHSRIMHLNGNCIQPKTLKDDCDCDNYTPKILDELGDLFFYKRVLGYIAKHPNSKFDSEVSEVVILLADLNLFAAQLLYDLIHRRELDTGRLKLVQERLDRILEICNCTLDKLTELNYAKLKDGDNHGWESARTLS
jgi:hypothetical protein